MQESRDQDPAFADCGTPARLLSVGRATGSTP